MKKLLIILNFCLCFFEQKKQTKLCANRVQTAYIITHCCFHYFCWVKPLKPYVTLHKTNKGEQLPALADETSVSRCLVQDPLFLGSSQKVTANWGQVLHGLLFIAVSMVIIIWNYNRYKKYKFLKILNIC